MNRHTLSLPMQLALEESSSSDDAELIVATILLAHEQYKTTRRRRRRSEGSTVRRDGLSGGSSARRRWQREEPSLREVGDAQVKAAELDGAQDDAPPREDATLVGGGEGDRGRSRCWRKLATHGSDGTRRLSSVELGMNAVEVGDGTGSGEAEGGDSIGDDHLDGESHGLPDLAT